MNKKIGLTFLVVVGFLFLLLIVDSQFAPFSQPSSSELGVEKFSSEEDFKLYLEEAESSASAGFFFREARAPIMIEDSLAAPDLAFAEAGKGGGGPDRFSQTTVQVLGIDEPDIVKTDGENIYFSSEINYYWGGPWLEDHPTGTAGTKIIKAFPPDELAQEDKIEKNGNLLLSGNTLLIFSYDAIFAYDVSDAQAPEKKWEVEFDDRSYLDGARLYQGKVYLITKTSVDRYHPCPIYPLEGLEVRCADIYHPRVRIPVDITYNAMILDPNSGEIEKTVSFVGTSSSSILYMSENSLYLTYSYYQDLFKFLADFIAENNDLFPAQLIEKIEKLETYDISDTAKMMEFEVIFEEYINSLSRDEEMKLENEFTNRISDYIEAHKRELGKTGIVKVNLKNFKVEATGSVPGQPLNQFSLDEYDGHLRIATTIDQMSGESANDVYILDDNLKLTGQVLDLGLTERIYSVRFIQDKGYVVTFKQIDPFYVLDLSDANNPELKGELKIPGYSSYLHPITKDRILGIGKEGSNVKVSLFDVTDPEEPREAAKYTLKEYWSDILNTHHAFLLDSKHQVFFLPGSRGGYVFSYEDDKLEMVKAVSDISARRAVYIDDYLYIIGDNKISVLDETTWEKVEELDLEF